jgi:aminopeptidase N
MFLSGVFSLFICPLIQNMPMNPAKLISVILLSLCSFAYTIAQSVHPDREKNWKELYRESPEKKFVLRHTKLNVAFDFAKRELTGEEWVTLKPFFYPQDKLQLDAKSMLIHEVKLGEKSLKFKSTANHLEIELDKAYTRQDSLTLYIRYTARPERVEQKGSAAVISAKGLYFIDPDGTDPEKPTQIWTQGETESSSCWFPTIDAPNQKTTQELYITVPDKYVTLSNGTLENQKKNPDGTRTDYWKFMMPHAPYLFFMGVGEFSVVKDTWKNIPVDYYVEKEYEPYAKKIFGNTPEMIEYFSTITGVTYPWPKYAQIVCRDYVSGAMENTTAVIHAENAHQDDKQLADENIWEDVIAHELFHHWFGDYVTCESWSNLTVNESFANYSEYLWREYKYGKDHADAHLYDDVKGYMTEENYGKDLVRFYYKDKEDMFDGVSYNKGGAILHLLRSYIGDDAFFAGLNKYLVDNQFGTGEAHQLRLAFEEVTGRDLNWFFNQWYFGSGHPKLNVSYTYMADKKEVRVKITQTQSPKVFRFPLKIDVYSTTGKTTHTVEVEDKEHEFVFSATQKPQWVNIDADRTLLAEINEDKSIDELIFQLLNGPKYLDRKLALNELLKHQKEKSVRDALIQALKDPYFGIRLNILEEADFTDNSFRKAALPEIEKIAASDKNLPTRAEAIRILTLTGSKSYLPIYKEAIQVNSYSMMGAGLKGLYETDKKAAIDFAKNYKGKPGENELSLTLAEIYVEEKLPEGLSFVARLAFNHYFMEEAYPVQKILKKGYDWVIAADDTESCKVLTDQITDLSIRYAQYGLIPLGKMALSDIKREKENLLNKNPNSLSLKEQVHYIEKSIEKLNP